MDSPEGRFHHPSLSRIAEGADVADPGFVHLHVHSSYSLLEGALTIGKLAELAKADRQPALGLADTDNMFGALEFSDKLAASGIQSIIGCALAVDFGDQEAPRHPGHALKLPRIVLLATREEGYRHLMRLTSQAFLDVPADQPAHVKLAALEAAADGLIALTGGPGGPLDLALISGHADLAAARCGRLAALFADLREALASTVEIAERCAFRPKVRKPILPRFTAEDGSPVDEAAELRRQADAGLMRRIQTLGLASGCTIDDYRKRLDFELGVIERMKYPGYFLIVADFIQWAKSKGIPVGPGRGSGAGSLVAYALTITDLDPIRFGLLFERFLNPERVSMPDFDIDFCQERRGEVIDYVQKRYGRDHVGQIITFGTLQARGVLRDVGRVLEMPYGQVDKLTKLVPNNPAAPVTLSKAIAEEPRLQAARDAEPVVRRAFDIAMKLEGLHRHASTHAAGIVIADRPLSELVPLYRDPKSDMPLTQFNMKWVEPAGLVKFDFLGLKTLTVLDKAVRLLRKRRSEERRVGKEC